MSARSCWLLVPLLAVAACADRPAAPVTPASVPEAATRFDPATAGTITGVVRWRGPAPTVEPFRSLEEPLDFGPDPPPARDWPNPNAPLLAGDRLAGAVVLLRGVDPQQARPWDHPAARVELRGRAFRVVQGGDSLVGFVRPGEPIDFVSRDDRLHVARARGAAFFSIALPRPNAPRTRRFAGAGVIEPSSGTGYFWMRAHLHVSDHPYLTRTDDAGRFRLGRVPPGDYDLVAWHPDWRVAHEARNPDLLRVQKVRFGPPLESVRRVRVRPAGTTDADLTLGPDAGPLLTARR